MPLLPPFCKDPGVFPLVVLVCVITAMSGCDQAAWQEVSPNFTIATAPRLYEWSDVVPLPGSKFKNWGPNNGHSIFGNRKGSDLWISGTGYLAHSKDGGETWNAAPLPLRSESPTSIYVSDDHSSVWALVGPRLFHFSGTSWSEVNYSENIERFSGSSVTGIGNQLWIAGYTSLLGHNLSIGQIVRSTDFGKTWNVLDIPEEQAESLSFGFSSLYFSSNGRQIWAVGGDGEIAHSKDGGENWEFLPRTISESINAICGSREGSILAAVGERGKLLQSSDAGVHWSQGELDLSFVSDFDTVHCSANGAEMWVTGKTGSVLRSVDSGKTWFADQSFEIDDRDEDPKDDLFLDDKGTVWVTKRWNLGVGSPGARVPFVSYARLTSDQSGDRVEFRVVNPDEMHSELTAELLGSNDDNFKHNDRLRASTERRSVTGTGLWSLPFKPNEFGLQNDEVAHFRIVLKSNEFAAGYEFSAVYRPWWRVYWKPLLTVCVLLAVLAAFALNLFLWPLNNLQLYRSLRVFKLAERIAIPGFATALQPVLKVCTLFLPWFVTHPRTLDAWVAKHSGVMSKAWDAESLPLETDPQRPHLSAYVPLPVRLQDPISGVLVESPNPKWLEEILTSDRMILQILGAGGAGKTSLARQIGNWALAGRKPGGLPSHAMIPVWVDEDLGEKNGLLVVIRRKLTGWMQDEEIENDLLLALLKKKRIVVIVDRLSERSQETQNHIARIHDSLQVGTLVVTSRKPLRFETETVEYLYPQPLDSSRLLGFMVSLLGQHAATEEPCQTPPFATMEAQLHLGNQLAKLIRIPGRNPSEEVPLLPLPVKLFVDQAVLFVREGRSLSELPRSLPEVYLRYLERVNPQVPVPNKMSDEDMLQAAKLLGQLALEDDFVPKEISKESARQRLREAGWSDVSKLDPVQRLIDNGVLVEKKILALRRIRFQLDPVAEYLAAAAWADECGSDSERWQNLEAISASASGFASALRVTRRVYAREFGSRDESQ